MYSKYWAHPSEITAQAWQAPRSRPKTPLSKLDRLLYWKQREEIIQNPQKIIEHKKFVKESFRSLICFRWVGVYFCQFLLWKFIQIFLLFFYMLSTTFSSSFNSSSKHTQSVQAEMWCAKWPLFEFNINKLILAVGWIKYLPSNASNFFSFPHQQE